MISLGSLASAAAVTAALLAALAAVPYDRELTYGFTRVPGPTPSAAPITPEDGLPYTRRGLTFSSQGTSCDAWLYTPSPPPKPTSGRTPSPTPDASPGAPIPDPHGDTAAPLSGSKTDAGAGSSSADGGAGGAALSSGVPPPALDRHPVVIMAHGLGGQKDLGLHRFADAFARAGLTVLVFDYRTFGGSDGEPRHWVSPRRHVEDWRAALAFVKSGSLGPEYDVNKVVLWGTSFAGGHVLVTAAEQPPGSIAAVISMVPHLDGVEASKANIRRRGLPQSLRLLLAGFHDATRASAARLLRRAGLLDPHTPAADGGAAAATADGSAATHGSGPLAALAPAASRWLAPYLAPAYVTLIASGSEMSFMQVSAHELEAYYSKHPKQKEGGWQPRVLARFALETSSYRPIAWVPRIAAPVLFVAATRDSLCPLHLVRRAAGLVPGGNGSLVELQCSHFEAYRGEHFEAAAEAMVRFAREQLLR